METAKQQYDRLTKTPVQKLIIKLSIPTILSMLGTTIYNLVDTAFVGTLGNSASGAVGVVFGFMAILQAIGFMFGQGAGSLLSRKLGEKNVEEATVIASTGFACSFLMATVVAILSLIFINPLVMFLGSTETIKPYAVTYLYFILATAPLVVTSFTLNNFLRYEGKAVLGMIGLMTGGFLNIFGDAVFMFGLKMGIAGAGLSTALSQLVSFSILLSMFLRGKTQARLSFKKIRINDFLPIDIMSTGFPSLLRQALGSVGAIVMNYEAARFAGDEAVAAMSIVSRVSFGLFSIALGIGQGFQPVCAFNYGAGKYKRLRDGYKFTTFLAEVAMIILAGIALIFSDGIIQIFRDDPDVIRIGTRALKLLCSTQILLPFSMVTEMLMQSSGKKKEASLLSALRNGILYIPALLILPMIRGLYGVQEAQPLAYILAVFPAVYYAKKFFKNIPTEDREDVISQDE